MEDFTSSDLQLVLGIIEGSNFDRIQKPTVIIATLKNQVLETRKISPNSNPQYATELIWDTDKSGFRKMRSCQSPIKVECYAINENGSREKLGYILLGVRCAQIIHHNEESKIKTNWHSILGVKNEFNSCKPKLSLYLIVREKGMKQENMLAHDKLNDNQIIHTSPIWLPDERLIQLGPLDTCQDTFQLYILVEVLSNTNHLLQELPANENKIFSFIFNIFDTFIRLKPFKLEPGDTYLNERVMIRIRTSLPFLKEYLQAKSHCFIKLKHQNDTIAISEVNLKPLVTVDSLREFVQFNENGMTAKEYKCILNGPYCKGETSNTIPMLKVLFKLQYSGFKKRSSGQFCSTTKNNILNPLNGVADVNQLISHPKVAETECLREKKSSSETYYSALKQPKENSQEHHKITMESATGAQNGISMDFTNVVDSYRNYSLNITLKSIMFFTSRLDVKNIEFRFYYSNGEIISNTVYNNVKIAANDSMNLNEVLCKLHFLSSPKQIQKSLINFAPKINICDATSSAIKCIGKILIDFRKFNYNSKFDCVQQFPIVDCDNQSQVGNSLVEISLRDHTMTVLSEIKNGDTEAILDNNVAYKIIDELETWKDRQKEIFQNELRSKEEAHLTLLNEEWKRHKECLESRLNKKIQQCENLASNLKLVTEDLKCSKIKSLEKEAALIQANEELQWKFDRKLHQLKDVLQKMQEDFMLKLSKLENQNQSLVHEVKLLTEENCELKKIKNKQEEKLGITQKDKLHFNEQLNEAVNQIHNMQLENQQAIKFQKKTNKEDLNNSDLEKILKADSTALTCDQIALSNIQQQIDIMKPDFSLQKFAKDQTISSKVLPNLGTNFITSGRSIFTSSREETLRDLQEEREVLLDSGKYSSDDSLILKLNANIESILRNG